jgi:hypothetical protein
MNPLVISQSAGLDSLNNWCIRSLARSLRLMVLKAGTLEALASSAGGRRTSKPQTEFVPWKRNPDNDVSRRPA